MSSVFKGFTRCFSPFINLISLSLQGHPSPTGEGLGMGFNHSALLIEEFHQDKPGNEATDMGTIGNAIAFAT